MANEFLTSEVILRGLRDHASDGAWRAFCERYEPMLRGIVRRAGVRNQDIADIVQEIMIAAVDGFRAGKFDESRGRLRGWLKGIAVNKIWDARRRCRRLERQVTDNAQSTAFMNRVPDDTADLNDLFEREWEQAVLAASLRQVRAEVEAQTFAAFERYALDGQPADEVASELGISRDAVYVCKSRVLARLQRWRAEFAQTW